MPETPPSLSYIGIIMCTTVENFYGCDVLQAEREKEEEYFDQLEKKESIEAKKDNITELRVTVVQCKEVCVVTLYMVQYNYVCMCTIVQLCG